MRHRKLAVFILGVTALLGTGWSAYAQEEIRLWKGTPVHGCSSVLKIYPPQGADTGKAIIICPGGSYFWLDKPTEGYDVANWLSSKGITAALLFYRVAGWFSHQTHIPTNFHPAMIEDLQRAIQIVRERCKPSELGLMGFSAGGHLVMTAAEFWDTDFLAPLGIECRVSLKPDFVAPIYPVVTLSDERYVHQRSRRALLGSHRQRNQQLRDSLSLEKHVRADGPRVFLLNCEDDPIVKEYNSVLLDSALTAAGVNHVYVRYPSGGHGFGATPKKQNEYTSQWQDTFINWLKND